ncbi:phosphatidic acid phosphatase type 2/haloperoxidase [Cokeromyces recurvatus]|uniref:phosphatidic acid phosphatase type 2/haloperoxidase n=1 Tax=Cokeromyces recurvatus TaxID=90255 RepID=UPI00221EDF1E|nr:phosphatidic acid phosphatase type 2/haloperoxidase [Cokeromyces recurvatus]KAI7905873.1 phosphatidic acid phosphatase type 2/haloperoxidase [Cokeromyces recurvatus]
MFKIKSLSSIYSNTSSLKKRLIISYGKDWVLVIIMVIVFFSIDRITPSYREFSINDTSIMHTYTVNESVPVWLLIVIAIIVPIVFITVISLGNRKSCLDFHSGLLGLALSLSMTIMITVIIKVSVGRPRPDMLDRCKPPTGIENPPLQLLNYTVCTAEHDTYKFKDGFKSFPSGHSSFSFAGLGYLSFYLAGKMHLFDEGGHTYKTFIFCFPFLGALLIAITRLHDYRHHWQDVFIGGIIGTLFAYFGYRQYYPSLASIISHKPFPPRYKDIDELFPGDASEPINDIEAARTHTNDTFISNPIPPSQLDPVHKYTRAHIEHPASLDLDHHRHSSH